MTQSDISCESLLFVMDSRVGMTEVLVGRRLPGVDSIFPKPGLGILFRELKFICGVMVTPKKLENQAFLVFQRSSKLVSAHHSREGIFQRVWPL